MTTHRVGDLLSHALTQIGALYQDQPSLILAAWGTLVGPHLASMSRATQFREGVLHVQVSNSPLFSLLTVHEKPRLLRLLQAQFPKVVIKNIAFRMG